jgi:hypothetical protein
LQFFTFAKLLGLLLIMVSSHSEAIQSIVDKLKQDLPTLFERDISYDIYSSDIEFRDPVNQFKGKLNYRIIFWTLRFHGKLFFTQLFFDLHDVSFVEPDTIRADWTVRGKLRVPWQANIFFNGYSIYSLNSDSLIDRHVDTWDRSPGVILKQFLPAGSDASESGK